MNVVTDWARLVAFCCLAVLAALYVVGVVSVPRTSVRHAVQTLPLWIPIVLGFRRRGTAKWLAMPLLLFWLAIVVMIWLFLLGWARLISDHFSPAEVVMTIVMGAASIVGLVASFRWRTAIRPLSAWGLAALSLSLQLVVFRLSMLPYIARR